MLSVIDYRNGRYQGQVSKNLPHGAGIFMHISLTFVVAEWINGRIQGHAMIIYPDSSIFCGRLSQGRAQGLCLYELEHDHVKLITYGKQDQQPRIVAISPVFNLLLQIKQFQQEKLHVIAEYQYSSSDQSSKRSTLGKCLGIQNMVSNWQTYENCFNFFRDCFVDKYTDLFQQMVISINGYKQLWMGFREAGLGIRLQPLEIGDDNRCVRSQAYRIRMMGVVSKENVLCGMGYRTIDDALKGLVFEQGVYALPQTLTTYDYPSQRPKSCSQNIANHLKRSLFFRNDYLQIGWIEQNMKLMKICHKDIFGEQQERIAQFVIENPNNDEKVMASIELKRRIKQQSRIERELQKERARPTHKKTDIQHSSVQLNYIKQQIYRSISRKKSTSNISTSPGKHQTLPQPQIHTQPQPQIAYVPPKSNTPSVKRQKQESPSRKTGVITPRKRTNPNNTSHSKDLSTEGRSTGKITKFDTPKPNNISPILKSPSKNTYDNTYQKKVVFKPIPKDVGLDNLEILPAKRPSPAKRPIQPLVQKDARKKILTQNVFI